jgi:DNA-binding transcriptional LysR family regulator
MDLYQLRYFLETARALNFSRAAEALGVSPSAISRSVGMLEASIGRPLFARTKRRVVLTAAGETLKLRAEHVFDEIERARAELSGEAPAPEQLKIGSREMIINYLLPEPLRDFQTRFPAARVGLYELSPAAMAHAVKTDRLDLGFHYAHLRDAALETSRLGTLPSHVYASKAYLKKHGRPAGLRALLKHPFIAPRAWEEDPTAPTGFRITPTPEPCAMRPSF